jgi:hypothetical protein
VPGEFQEDNPAKGPLTTAYFDQKGLFRKKMPTHTYKSKNKDFSQFLSLNG